MDYTQATSLAYFDGKTVKELEELNLSDKDLIIIAVICWKWAQLFPNAYAVYLYRASAILKLLESDPTVE